MTSSRGNVDITRRHRRHWSSHADVRSCDVEVGGAEKSDVTKGKVTLLQDCIRNLVNYQWENFFRS